MQGAWFHYRAAAGPDEPAGITVSKKRNLPEGDFRITEYIWGAVTLWFVNDDKFTPDERQAAYEAFCASRRESLTRNAKQ